MKFYIAQGIGFAAMALLFFAFQQNDKRKILWGQATAAILFTFHYLLLGAWTGMVMNMLVIPRNLILAKENKHQKIWAALFIAAFIGVGLFAWESPLSIFPILGMALSTIAFSLKKPRHIRLCNLPVSALWLTYNILSLSIAGACTEIFNLLSIAIAIVRFDLIPKKSEQR